MDPISPRIGAAIVGAQKCGTTTLATVLGSHPDVCLAAGKEAHLFDRPDVQQGGPSSDDLARCFPDRRDGQLLLDATPSYLYLPGCLDALVRHAPEVRVVVMLRSPAERAVSHFHHERRLGFERLPFAVALALEGWRLRRDRDPLAPESAHRHWSYLDRGRYAAQLERLDSLTSNVHVVLLDELVADPGRVIGGVEEFLGVDRRPHDHVPHLNAGDGRRHRCQTRLAALALRRSVEASERRLARRSGSLREGGGR